MFIQGTLLGDWIISVGTGKKSDYDDNQHHARTRMLNPEFENSNANELTSLNRL